MGSIRLAIWARESDSVTIDASDGNEQRAIKSVDDVRRFLSDRGDSINEQQYRGLGIATALLAATEFRNKYRVYQLGKVLDGIYFPIPNPVLGRAFDRGLADGIFELSRHSQSADLLDDLVRRTQEAFGA